MSYYEKVNSIKSQNEKKKFIENPINAFILIRMLTIDIKRFEAFLKPENKNIDEVYCKLN